MFKKKEYTENSYTLDYFEVINEYLCEEYTFVI
jgi:hypothetical protein